MNENNTNETPAVVAVEREGDGAPVVRPIAWWQTILVRAIRAAIASLGGGVIGGWATGAAGLPQHEQLKAALITAGGAFVWSALQNSAELLARFDQTNPKLRG